VLLTLEVGQIILLEAALSFLGVGAPPPTPSLGSVSSEGLPYLMRGWWISVFPGIVLTLLIVATNLVGDWLRDRWDPKIDEVI
jgi:peptide/nickel transport system permease protein